jgi:O-antigen ligase
LNIFRFGFYLPLVLLFCAVLFADFIPSFFGAYDDQRVLLSLSVIVLITFGLLELNCRQKIASASAELWPFFPLIFTFGLSALEHSSASFSMIEPVFYALFFLSFGLIGYVIRGERLSAQAAQGLMMVAVVCCFFYAAITLMVFLFSITDDFSHFNQMVPWGFVNIRYWSHTASWLVPLFPLCLLVLPWKDNRLWRCGVTFTAAIWWWILFLSSSRGSIIGLFAGLVLAWLFFGKAALPWVKLFVRFAIYGLIFWLLLSVIIPGLMSDDLQVRGIKGDSSGRMPMWLEAWAMSLQNFPFGMGPQSWLKHEVLTGAYRASPKFAHPHNMYLMWAAEYGWISIAALALLCTFALRNLRSRISSVRAGVDEGAPYLIALTASVTAAFVHGGVSAVFMAPGSMLIGLPVLTVFWACIRPESSVTVSSEVALGPNRSRFGGYLLVLVFVLSSVFWFREVLRYRQAMIEDLGFYQEEVVLGQLPRFWLHGNYPRHESQMPDLAPPSSD